MSIAEIIHELRVSGDPTEEKWADEIERLTNQLVKAQDALRFYADQKNYSDDYWRGLWKTAQAALTDD